MFSEPRRHHVPILAMILGLLVALAAPAIARADGHAELPPVAATPHEPEQSLRALDIGRTLRSWAHRHAQGPAPTLEPIEVLRLRAVMPPAPRLAPPQLTDARPWR